MAGPDPTDWLVPFSWHGVNDENKPATGSLICTPRADQISTSDLTDPVRVYLGPVTVSIIDGIAAGELLATDYPGNSNQRFTWHIEEQLTNGTGYAYDVEMPISMQTEGVLLGAIAPTAPTPGMPVQMVSRAEFDELVRRVDALSVLSQGDGTITRMTFNDGVDGGLMVAGGLVTFTFGKVRYKAAASKYPSGLGLGMNGPIGDWGNFSVASPNVAAADYQIYFKLNTVGTKFGMDFVNFVNNTAGTTGMGNLAVRTNRILAFSNPGAGTGSTLATPLPVGVWIRLDLRVVHDGTTGTYIAQVYWTDPEGTIADGAITITYPSPSVDKIKWGLSGSTNDWNVDVDTLSFKPGTEKPIPPMAPSPTVWLHEYEAINDRTMAVGDIGMEDATAAVACQSLMASAKHGIRGLRTTNGYAEYPVRNPAGQTGSAYFRRNQVGVNNTPIVSWMAGTTQVASVRMKPSGSQNIILTSAGATLATSALSSIGNTWFRVDWSHTWTSAAGGTLVVTARINYPAAEAGEGTTYDTITATITGVAQPTSTRIGFSDTTGGTWIGDVDSHRQNPNTTLVTVWQPIGA